MADSSAWQLPVWALLKLCIMFIITIIYKRLKETLALFKERWLLVSAIPFVVPDRKKHLANSIL